MDNFVVLLSKYYISPFGVNNLVQCITCNNSDICHDTFHIQIENAISGNIMYDFQFQEQPTEQEVIDKLNETEHCFKIYKQNEQMYTFVLIDPFLWIKQYFGDEISQSEFKESK